MKHLYHIGQILEMRSAPRQGNRPAGPCEVKACLPHEKGPVLYRVKSASENNERVVEETDLFPSSARKSAIAEGETAFTIAVSKR